MALDAYPSWHTNDGNKPADSTGSKFRLKLSAFISAKTIKTFFTNKDKGKYGNRR